MKNIFVYITLFLFALNANSQITKAEIIATGLTCSMCSNAINKQFKALVEVDKVETDLNTNTFTVYLKKDTKITPKILKERVEKAGFFVGSMIVTMQFENLNISDNLSVTQDNLPLIFIDSKPKTLNGETRIKILDKGFVTQKEYKKLSKLYAKYPSYAFENEDNYHLKTI
ncbi:heavy-metal-associated domain-containing protein [Flavobacterium sp.]|uniref:heavy-metal-associated domain-containing protein n=1 Tax=Flavobacterium sp. TaxID=239 RepID=UPI0037509F6B